MQNIKTKHIVIALVVLSIMDGDFKDPSILDYIKFILMAIALYLVITRKE